MRLELGRFSWLLISLRSFFGFDMWLLLIVVRVSFDFFIFRLFFWVGRYLLLLFEWYSGLIYRAGSG